jgi:hypothetical protein
MSRSLAIAAAAVAIAENTSLDMALKRIVGSGPHDLSPAFYADVAHAFEHQD